MRGLHTHLTDNTLTLTLSLSEGEGTFSTLDLQLIWRWIYRFFIHFGEILQGSRNRRLIAGSHEGCWVTLC